MNFRYHLAFSPLPASNPFPFRPSPISSRHSLNSPRLRPRLSQTFRTSSISAPNSCLIRTYKNRSRNCFRIRTYAPPSDLRILKDLPFPNFSRNPFIFCTYRPPRICGKQTTYNPCIIRTYKIPARNSFRIRTYKNHRGSISLCTPTPRPTFTPLPVSAVRTSPLLRSVPPSARRQLSAVDCQLHRISFLFTSFADPSFYPLSFHIFPKNTGEGVLRGFSRNRDHGPRATPHGPRFAHRSRSPLTSLFLTEHGTRFTEHGPTPHSPRSAHYSLPTTHYSLSRPHETHSASPPSHPMHAVPCFRFQIVHHANAYVGGR